MDDVAIVGAIAGGIGAVAGALGNAVVSKFKAARVENRADMDAANAAWQKLFEKSEARADGLEAKTNANAAEIVLLNLKNKECQEQHAECERRNDLLESRVADLERTVEPIAAKVNGK